MMRRLRTDHSHVAEEDAPSRHQATSPPVQLTPPAQVFPLIHPAPTAQPQTYQL